MKKNKALKVLSTAALAATLVVPAALPASAAATYKTASNPQKVEKNKVIESTLRVSVEISPGSLTTTEDTVRFRLPSGSYAPAPVAEVASPTQDNQVAKADVAGVAAAGPSGNYNEFELKVERSQHSSKPGLVYIDLKNVFVPSSVNDKFDVTFDARPGSAFSTGTVTVATVGSGGLTATVDDIKSLQPGKNQAIDTIRIKEDRAGAVKPGEDFTLKLPKGFTWRNLGESKQVWGGSNGNFEVKKDSGDDRKLVLTYKGNETTTAGYWTLSGLSVDVDDDEAKTGDVTVDISGSASSTTGSLVVARYGTYGTSIKAADALKVWAGRDDEDVANITIQEDAPGSLYADRTIKLTLSGNAKWHTVPKIDNSLSDLQGFELEGNFEISKNDPATVTATVKKASSGKPAKIVLKDGTVDLAADAKAQDITVTAGGTASLTGTATIAKVVSPVSAAIEGTIAKAIIGAQNQELSPIVITEAGKGALDDKKTGGENQLVLQFPKGVTPKTGIDVKVTDGDIVLDTNNIAVNTSADTITIPVKYASTKPSKIKISNIKADVDRTVAEGPLEVDVTGGALVKTASKFPNTPSVTKVAAANIVTPADGNKTAQNIVFKIGSKTYTVEGEERTMDVAPEVHPVYNRTYIPAAHFAASLNIPADKVVWNEASKTVTIFAGDKVVSATAGKKELVVNGTVVKIDAPVNYGQHTSYRVMVPYTHLALALGATVEWKADTQEIFVNKK